MQPPSNGAAQVEDASSDEEEELPDWTEHFPELQQQIDDAIQALGGQVRLQRAEWYCLLDNCVYHAAADLNVHGAMSFNIRWYPN
jgi:DNA topoisomerase IB